MICPNCKKVVKAPLPRCPGCGTSLRASSVIKKGVGHA